MIQHIILFLIIIFTLTTCTHADRKEETVNNDLIYKTALNDSIFNPLKKCLSETTSSQILWTTSQLEINDEDSEHRSYPFKVLGSTKDLKEIWSLIDSFPVIKPITGTLEFARVSSESNLYFICNNDTLINGNWDPARHQIYINGNPYQINFDKLYRTLERLPKNISNLD
jgi:hypothetical protein